MNKFLTCAPKLERLLIWTRGQGNGGPERWQLKENDDAKGVVIVELIKGKNQSLGLTISGGTDKPKPPHVANIRSGGLADQSDYFCVGDLILEINEKDVTKLKHSELIKFIQEAGKRLTFKMQYKKLVAEDAETKTTTLNLCKEHNETKFTLRGGRSKDGVVNRPFVIADLKQESEIASCGDLFEGDIVLAVDNKSIDNLHATEVKAIVKELKTQFSLKIQFTVQRPALKETPRGSVMIEISRPHESIQPGMHLDVSLDHEQQGSIVVISKVTSSGLAARTGAITVGDLVLSINGISLDGMSVDQARKMIETSGKVIQLEMLPMEQPPVASPAAHGSMDEFLQFLAKDKPPESDLRIKTPTLPVAKPALRQYPSKTSLSSLKRLNSLDRNLSTLKQQDLMTSYQSNYRSLKRNVLPNNRFASFDDTRSVMSASSTMSQCNVGNMLSRTEVTGLVLIAEDGDFGIEVQDGLSGFDLNCIVVRVVVAGKAADRSGVVQVGDRILSINGIRTEYMSSEDFQRALCESGTSVRMEIEFDVTDSIVPSSGTFTVKIPRSENSGIILAETNREDTEKYLRVVDIKKASIAYRMGILVPGDQIIHINGASTSGYSLYEANELIRRCYDVMRITVKKDEEIQGNTFGVEFNRRGEALGITISGSEEPFDPIYITSIAEDSIAGRSGAVLAGDRLLAINEITLRGKPLWKAFESLRMAGDVVKLLIKRNSSAPRPSYEKESSADCCELTSVDVSRDVQQWVINNNNNLEDIIEKERCPTSQGSASTESYCDISDNADTQSSASDRPSSTRKRVAKRPVLPAWQRECLKNFDDCASTEGRYQEFTKSDNFSKAFESDVPRSLFATGGRSACDVRLKSAFQPIDSEDSRSPFSWSHALSSGRKEIVVYDSSEADCDSALNASECLVTDQFEKGTEVRLGALEYPKKSAGYKGDIDVSEKNTAHSSAKLESDFLVDEIVDGQLPQYYSDLPKREASLNPKRVKSSLLGKENTDPPKSRTNREKQLDDDKPKSRLLNQGPGGGLLQAVAFFENLEKGKLPERKSNRSSSLKSFKSRSARYSESEKSHTLLERSPFQLGMTKSERYLRELERKTEAEYKEMKEKLGDSSSESITDKRPGLSHKANTFSRFDSGYSTADAKLDSPLAPNHGSFGKGAEDDVDCDEKHRTSTHRIVLTKHEFDKDFGFSVSERIDGKGIYVKSIQASAGKSGKLKKYDRILQVNGIHTRELTCDQVVPLLQRAGRRLQLVVQRVQRDHS